jgi:hypothetical protein
LFDSLDVDDFTLQVLQLVLWLHISLLGYVKLLFKSWIEGLELWYFSVGLSSLGSLLMRLVVYRLLLKLLNNLAWGLIVALTECLKFTIVNKVSLNFLEVLNNQLILAVTITIILLILIFTWDPHSLSRLFINHQVWAGVIFLITLRFPSTLYMSSLINYSLSSDLTFMIIRSIIGSVIELFWMIVRMIGFLW